MIRVPTCLLLHGLLAAVPVAAPGARALVSVTVQVTRAPGVLRFVQVAADTPVPTVVPVALTPAGNCVARVAVVPEAVPPLLPRPIV